MAFGGRLSENLNQIKLNLVKLIQNIFTTITKAEKSSEKHFRILFIYTALSKQNLIHPLSLKKLFKFYEEARIYFFLSYVT